jgi:hypothetical protein
MRESLGSFAAGAGRERTAVRISCKEGGPITRLLDPRSSKFSQDKVDHLKPVEIAIDKKDCESGKHLLQR